MKYRNLKNNNSGFVILFAVMLSGIILAIALGVADISFKEIRFSTSAKDTNEAFFAADAGAECALYYDSSDPTKNAFTGGVLFVGPMSCAGNTISLLDNNPRWDFTVVGLGEGGQGCAKVTVDKSAPPATYITSKGYNLGGASCASSSTSLVERQLDINY